MSWVRDGDTGDTGDRELGRVLRAVDPVAARIWHQRVHLQGPPVSDLLTEREPAQPAATPVPAPTFAHRALAWLKAWLR